MTRETDTAFPMHDTNGEAFEYANGLTKLEYFAGMAMNGMLANDWQGYAEKNDECHTMAFLSINYAKALIKALNATI